MAAGCLDRILAVGPPGELHQVPNSTYSVDCAQIHDAGISTAATNADIPENLGRPGEELASTVRQTMRTRFAITPFDNSPEKLNPPYCPTESFFCCRHRWDTDFFIATEKI